MMLNHFHTFPLWLVSDFTVTRKLKTTQICCSMFSGSFLLSLYYRLLYLLAKRIKLMYRYLTFRSFLTMKSVLF